MMIQASLAHAAYSIRLALSEKQEIQHAFLCLLPSSFHNAFAVILQVRENSLRSHLWPGTDFLLVCYDLMVLRPMNFLKLSF